MRLCGDGDMMEGVTSEAASLAGHLKLGNLCWIYDNNRITIEGNTDLAFSEDVAARFLAYGWNVTRVSDANDTRALARALETFRRTSDRPTLIIVDSHIGYGAPHKQDTSAAHGEPLGEEEVRLAKRGYGWPEDAQVSGARRRARAFPRRASAGAASELRGRLDRAVRSLPRAVSRISPTSSSGCSSAQLPEGWDKDLPTFPPTPRASRRRDSSGKVLNAIAQHYPWLIGGAADLAPSTKTRLTSRAPAISRPAATAAAICISAFANMPWARS